MKTTTVIAQWNESTEAYETPQGWVSLDGDNWLDEHGIECHGEIFDTATIAFNGGPRDGEVVG